MFGATIKICAFLCLVWQLYLSYPPTLWNRIVNSSISFWFDKRLIVEVDGELVAGERRQEIIAALPIARSVPWWHMNLNTVAADLYGSAQVLSSKVGRCGDDILQRWSCFHVVVSHRKSKFLVKLGGAEWLVDGAGVFIKPAVARSYALNKLLVVDGTQVEALSPDYLKGMLAKLANITGEVKGIVGEENLVRIEVERDGYLILELLSPEMGIRINLLQDDPSVASQLGRLARAFATISKSEESYRLLDLSFKLGGVGEVR